MSRITTILSLAPALLATALLAPALLAAPSALRAQMEKRWTGEYDGRAFAASAPAVGELAPDLALGDLDGRPWSTRLLLGRTVVLVKGSYT